MCLERGLSCPAQHVASVGLYLGSQQCVEVYHSPEPLCQAPTRYRTPRARKPTGQHRPYFGFFLAGRSWWNQDAKDISILSCVQTEGQKGEACLVVPHLSSSAFL